MTVQLSTAIDAFRRDSDETLQWLGATEALWLKAPPATDVRRHLKTPQMEALYEAAFLRVFTAWEVFLEDACLRMMAGASSSQYSPRPVAGKSLHRTITSARGALYGSRRFLLWHDPARSADRVAGHLDSSALETELRSRLSWFEDVGQIRHRVAHASTDARDKFRAAALSLTGTTHGGRPGKLLRAPDPGDSLNMKRWIVVITDELKDSATRICS
jgi:hypothetical protein